MALEALHQGTGIRKLDGWKSTDAHKIRYLIFRFVQFFSLFVYFFFLFFWSAISVSTAIGGLYVSVLHKPGSCEHHTKWRKTGTAKPVLYYMFFSEAPGRPWTNKSYRRSWPKSKSNSQPIRWRWKASGTTWGWLLMEWTRTTRPAQCSSTY